DREALVDGVVAGVGDGRVVDRDDRVRARARVGHARREDRRAPARDRPVLRCEEKERGSRRRRAGGREALDLESALRARRVEGLTGGGASRARRIRRAGDRDHERLRRARRVVERREADLGVGDPEGTRHRFAHAPGIDEVRIEELGDVDDAVLVGQGRHTVDRLVDDEIRLEVARADARGPRREEGGRGRRERESRQPRGSFPERKPVVGACDHRNDLLPRKRFDAARVSLQAHCHEGFALTNALGTGTPRRERVNAMQDTADLSRKADALRALHRPGRPLVLVNAWDAASARIVERAGSPAVATTSAGIAFASGYPDGEVISRERMLEAVRRICDAVAVPVTADVEAAYGDSAEEVRRTVSGVLAAGAVGMNLEDGTGRSEAPLGDLALQVEKIRTGVDESRRLGVALVLNARTDVYLDRVGPEAGRLEETVRRGSAYRDAGADCIFVPGVTDPRVIAALVERLACPV